MQADEEFGWFSCKVSWGFFLYFPSYLVVFIVRGVQFLVLAISQVTALVHAYGVLYLFLRYR